MNAESQMSLFDEQLIGKNIQFLHVIKDLKPVEMSNEELFDTTLYDELIAVTFVASPKFFFNTTKNFKKIDLIFGIEDGNVASPFATGLEMLFDVESRINIIKSLPQSILENICSNQYQVRYVKHGYSVHSKFY